MDGSGGSVPGTGGATSGAPGSGGRVAGGSGGSAAGTVACGGIGPENECRTEEYCCDYSCTPNDAPCDGAAFHCDEATDCPGSFCCVTKISMRGDGGQVAECRNGCSDAELVMCKHGGGDDCPLGMECRITATLPPPYGYCCPPGMLCPTT